MGNWLNANDSIDWVLSLQPQFSVYKNEFWEYGKISGSDQRLKVSLKNQGRALRLDIKFIDSCTISIKSQKGEARWLTRIKAVTPNFQQYENEGFGDIHMVDDTAVIMGFIEDYNHELYDGTGEVLLYHAMHGYNKEFSQTKFNIDTTGLFKVSFRAFNPQLVNLIIDGSIIIGVMVSPGDTTIVGFNKLLTAVTEDDRMWKSYTDWQISHYMGKNAMLSEEVVLLHQKYSRNIGNNPTIKFENMDIMSQLEYIRWRKDVYQIEKQMIDSLLHRFGCSKKARQYFHLYLDHELLAQLYRYQINASRFQQIGPLYTIQIPYIHDCSVVNMTEPSYISYLNYLSIYDSQNPLGVTSEGIKKYFLNSLLPKARTPDDYQQIKNLIDQPAPKPEDFISRDSFAEDNFDYDNFMSRKVTEINEGYYKVMELYSDLIPDTIIKKGFLCGLDLIMEKYDHNIHSQFYATYKIQNYIRNSSLGSYGREWILHNINDSVIKKVMLEKLDRKILEESSNTEYAENTFFIDKVNSLDKPADFFDSLIRQFKGKVIYIDFWADWCSPCRAGFKSAKRLKEAYANDDVVFLYLGYNCKLEGWVKAIKHDQVSGYHYWLDKEQSAIMKEKFGIIGIPHYLLLDRNGQALDEIIPGPSSRAEIVEIIDKLLGER